jgi:hypothetical protein
VYGRAYHFLKGDKRLRGGGVFLLTKNPKNIKKKKDNGGTLSPFTPVLESRNSGPRQRMQLKNANLELQS